MESNNGGHGWRRRRQKILEENYEFIEKEDEYDYD